MNKRDRRRRDALAAVVFIAGFVAWSLLGYAGQGLLAEIAVLALFAMSLDFIVGYAGLASLGHALYFGLGAYAMAGLTVHLGWPPGAGLVGAVLAASVAALLTGALVVKLGGVFIIMTTLAFGQMGWAYVLRSPVFGGVSGLAGVPALDVSAVGLSLMNPADFTLLALVACLLCYLLFAWLADAPFGHMLVALHENEGRAEALGLPVYRYKLAAFVIAGAMAALAGTLSAQRTQFVSPDLMFWTTSGEALIIVILGGVRTLIGPIVGALVWVMLRHLLSEVTTYWMFVMGVLFIAVVLFTDRGLYGVLSARRAGTRHA